MIFVSTGGCKDAKASETANTFYQAGIRHIELSGGLYSKSLEKELAALPDDLTLQIHNYYPPPAVPFVFNLSSGSDETLDLSMAHVRGAMKLALELKRPFYAFHAGFRVDPKVSELGRRLAPGTLMDRASALEIFSVQVSLLAKEAESLGVTLLIENNVLSSSNLSVYGENPLLLTHPDEIEKFFLSAPENVGLLLDVAHLKVSSHSQAFNLVDAHERLKPWIRAYHLSDNDGSEDSNEAVTEDSWFWPFLVRELDFYTLEVYGVSPASLRLQQDLVQRKLYALLDTHVRRF